MPLQYIIRKKPLQNILGFKFGSLSYENQLWKQYHEIVHYSLHSDLRHASTITDYVDG